MIIKWIVSDTLQYMEAFNWVEKSELRIVQKCYPKNVLQIIYI